MVAVKINTFGGMVPAVDDTLLPDQAATLSQNAWLYSGAIAPLPKPKLLHATAVTFPGKVYRIPANYSRASYLFGSAWLEFEDADTDVIHAPVFGDSFDRYYWTSNGLAPHYNTKARILASQPPFLLGIEPPSSAPGLTSTGGSSGTLVVRAYVVTWVSAYGEESAPSPPALLQGDEGDTWSLTLPSVASGDLGTDRNLDLVRIYRTITSTAGISTYFLVTEQAIATTTYDDSAPDSVIAGNAQLESFEWTPPPADLRGFLMMPNGIVASWRDNELWFSEAYRPHAWPVSYVLTEEYPIVGLGITGQTLVACTAGYPVAAGGTTPGSITSSRLANFEPCLSRGSILSAPEGVYYAGPSGLVLVSQGVAQNITKDLITRDRWEQITKDTVFRAARIGTGYYGFGSVAPGVFNLDAFEPTAFANEDFTGALNGVLIDPANGRVAMTTLVSDTPISGVQNDQWSGELLILKDNNVYWIDQGDIGAPTEVAIWRSKKFQSPAPSNFGALQVFFEILPSTPVQNPVRNTDTNMVLADDQYGLVKVYADDRLVQTRELRTSGEVLRPLSGFKATYWQFEIQSRVKIKSVYLASSIKELAGG